MAPGQRLRIDWDSYYKQQAHMLDTSVFPETTPDPFCGNKGCGVVGWRLR